MNPEPTSADTTPEIEHFRRAAWCIEQDRRQVDAAARITSRTEIGMEGMSKRGGPGQRVPVIVRPGMAGLGQGRCA